MIKLANINLFVENIDTSVAFYENLLGLEVDRELSEPAMVVIKNDTCKLSLQTKSSMGKRVTSSDGIELGFEVDEVDALWQKLVEAKIEVMGEPVSQGFGRTFDARDPDGYHVTFYKLAY